MNREQKQIVIQNLTDKISKAHIIVFVDYSGLTHQQIESFKKEFQGDFLVSKNTLIKFALKNNNIDVGLQSPTGIILLYNRDVSLLPLLRLQKQTTKSQAKLGIINRLILTKERTDELLKLNRKTLLSQINFLLQSPLLKLDLLLKGGIYE